MNFDPYDSVAWKSFGMLDAEETALFDDAAHRELGLKRACLEMDRLAAAVAATIAEPILPSPDQLEDVQRRLGLVRGKSNTLLWLAISGWAAALALAGLWAWSDATEPEKPPARVSESVSPSPVSVEEDAAVIVRRNEQIEQLRQSLEEFHERESAMFKVLPGRALPLVMLMLPPDEKAVSVAPLTALLGDALAAANRHPVSDEPEDDPETVIDPAAPTEEVATVSAAPMAVPIYDVTRDVGTLVVNNLPPAGDGNVYNLWVVMNDEGEASYLGSLPESSALGAESFDFSLGSSMALPIGFQLTLDPKNKPVKPTEENTVLLGPPALAR